MNSQSNIYDLLLKEENKLKCNHSVLHVLVELTFGEVREFSLSKAGKISEETICITVFSSGARCWMLSCLLSWTRGEWADHVYSL